MLRFIYINRVIFYSPRGFVSTIRANPLAQKIIKADIAFGLNATHTFYTADNCMQL